MACIFSLNVNDVLYSILIFQLSEKKEQRTKKVKKETKTDEKVT